MSCGLIWSLGASSCVTIAMVRVSDYIKLEQLALVKGGSTNIFST